ncbi:hypothetical protein G7054_g6903 [Neopestalotiopsis clavispora]|nr:hypothetical protein E8E14_001361 [Neopestalotiopsis sp. 37M]KAF7533635.1 hypothetical protein G7054_g6903 [Neopestalotiopsis clavispora]
MAHISDSEHHKRKRHEDDNGGKPHTERIPQPPPPQSGNQAPINYLARVNAGKLKLIQGDTETFTDVLTLINEYEGVLSRHESFASNLGAKLMGPRLLKAMEGIFDGPIITIPTQTPMSLDPITWVDIVEFSKARPAEFNLTTNSNGGRCCQFFLKGVQVEISEDDWRVIVSGTLDRNRLIPPQPLEEDETAEFATLEILEQRLKILIKKADEVAGKARQLNYHLSGRKAAIGGRRSTQHGTGSTPSSFQAVNQAGPPTGPNHHGYDLHADLLQQFITHNPSNRLPSVSSVPPTPGTATSTPRTSIQQQVLTSVSNRPSPGAYAPEVSLKDPDDEHRALVTSRVDKLARGDEILPPCDRCRRLKTPCIKHLTACQGCTKKHARCSWKALTDEEVAWLRHESGDVSGLGVSAGEDTGDEQRERRYGSQSAPSSQQDPNEPRRLSDRSDDPGPGRSVSRIAIGRSADDIWRMGTSSSSRRDSMDVDVDPRDTHGLRPTARVELHATTRELHGHGPSVTTPSGRESSITSPRGGGRSGP